MKYLILSVALAAFIPISVSAIHGQAVNPALRQELLDMETVDQDARFKCIKETAEKQIDCLRIISETIDQKNTNRLREIYKTHGFPTERLVGHDGFQAFMLLLQHSMKDDLRIAVQRSVRNAFIHKELPPQDYANFIDRLRLHQGKPQLYGQGFSFKDGKLVMDPIIDPKNIDKRRRKIGLPPIEEEVRMLKEIYKVDVEMPPVH